MASLNSSTVNLTKHCFLHALRPRERLTPSRPIKITQIRAESPDANADNGNPSLQEADRGLDWLSEQGKKIEQIGARDAEEVELVRSVGLERAARGVREIDETDEKRYPWHRKLKACAEMGEYNEAEAQLEDMRKNGMMTPGPLAFHALVLSYVKANYPQGALAAIRKAYDAGVQPTAPTYAAVTHAFLKNGDINRAEAVYASNRRAGVDSSKSWVVLVDGLFKLGQGEHALEVLEQGESEGLIPNESVYERLLRFFAMNHQLEDAIYRLDQMVERDMQVTKSHIAPIVTAAALTGNMEAAEELFVKLLKAPGKLEAATVGAVNALLQMFLGMQLGKEELAIKVAKFRQTLAKFNIGTDRKGYSLYLEAGLYLDDLQLAMFAFQSLKKQGEGNRLQYVGDEQLAEMLRRLSLQRRPADLYEVLSTMASERRLVPEEALETIDGHTFVTQWLSSAGSVDEAVEEEEEEDMNRSLAKPIELQDGVRLHPETLESIDDDGKPMTPAKMSVRELRAELLYRRVPVKGSKRDLQKKLTRARSGLMTASEEARQKAQSKKVAVTVVEEEWSAGKVDHQNTYADEVDELEDDTADNIEDQYDDDFEEGSTRKKRAKDEDDDDDDEEDEVDYEEIVSSIMKAAGGRQIDLSPFSNEVYKIGAIEALGILDAAMAAGVIPTSADIRTIWELVLSSEDAEAREKGAPVLRTAFSKMPTASQAEIQDIVDSV